MSHGFNIGDVVVFGAENGQKTRAKIAKLNPKTAVCKSLDARGRHPVGTEWKVGYTALTKLDANGVAIPKAPALPSNAGNNIPLEYHPFHHVENHLYAALLQVYCELSPESLTGDGEIPMSQVRARKMRLERFQKGIFAALGRSVSEEQIYAWDRSKAKWYEQHKTAEAMTPARRENRWNSSGSLASQIAAVESGNVVR
jgi:hypothetical protein